MLSLGVVKINHFSILNPEVIKEKIKDALIGRVPLTDDIVISPANKTEVSLKIKISVKETAFFVEAIKNADSNIKALFGELEIGENLHPSKIIDRAFLMMKTLKPLKF